jgi:hypothetical protein
VGGHGWSGTEGMPVNFSQVESGSGSDEKVGRKHERKRTRDSFIPSSQLLRHLLHTLFHPAQKIRTRPDFGQSL